MCLFALSQAETRAEFAERTVQKLQKEVDRLEGTYKIKTLAFIYHLCTMNAGLIALLHYFIGCVLQKLELVSSCTNQWQTLVIPRLCVYVLLKHLTSIL